MKISSIILFCVIFGVAACGESTEEAYERGYEDGWDDLCGEIAQFSSRIETTLEREKIC